MRITGLTRALPQGTLAVGGGLVVYGITAYGFLVLSGRALGPQRYVGISVLWALVFLCSIGFFVPLEQVVARALATRKARGLGGATLVRRAGFIGTVLLASLLLALVGLSPVLVDALFEGHVWLLASLGLALCGYLLGHVVRGVLSGVGDLATYGLLLAVEGSVRLGATLVLVMAGVRSPGPYAAALALAPLVAVVLTVRRQPEWAGPDEPGSWRELSTALGHLLTASLLSQALVNGPVLAVKILASDQETLLAGRFLAALVVTRVPVFLLAAVQASLVPRLAGLAAQGRLQQFRSELLRLAALVTALVVAGTLASYLVGPPIVRAFFGPEFAVERGVLTVLAAGNGAFMLAVLAAQALIALGRHAYVTLGWMCGVAGFIAAVFVNGPLASRVGWAFIAGAAVAVAAMAAPLGARPGARSLPDGPPLSVEVPS